MTEELEVSHLRTVLQETIEENKVLKARLDAAIRCVYDFYAKLEKYHHDMQSILIENKKTVIVEPGEKDDSLQTPS